MKNYIVGIDVGGTHIDGVLLKDQKIIKFLKIAYLKNEIIEGIDKLILELIKDINIDDILRVSISTTISTNTIVNSSGKRCNLIIESGPGINNDFSYLDANIYKLSSYINHQGSEIIKLKDDELKEIKSKLSNDHLGIVTKFSNRNPNHELEISDYFNDDFGYISMGHLFSGNLNFPRRVDTVFLNNYIYDNFKPFAQRIARMFPYAKILKADGGTLDLSEAIRYPIETIMSGPAASFMGMKALIPLNSDGVLFDIGGSTTDIFFVVKGDPIFEPKGISVGKYKTLIRSIYAYPLNIGGDSRVVFENNEYKFLKREGFAAGFNGKYPTLTDALIVLGQLSQGDYNLAAISLKTLNSDNVENIAKEIVNKYLIEVSKVVDIEINKINLKPIYTINEVLENKIFKPKFMGAIGGPAFALKTYLEAKLNLACYIPKEFAYANALGAALSLDTKEISVIANTKIGKVVVSKLGYQANIDRNYTVNDAIALAISLLDSDTVEITEQSSFNMVTYGQLAHKNIRVKAQIKPQILFEVNKNEK